MKMRFQRIGLWFVPLTAAWLLAASHAQATTNTNSAAAKPTVASAKAAEAETAVVEIPKSAFVMPTNAATGKDPFFPASSYPYSGPTPVVRTSTVPTVIKVPELLLGGVSGSADKPIAIINNVNFGVGEELDVLLGGKKMRVRCLEINLEQRTVVVQMGGQRQILRMRSN